MSTVSPIENFIRDAQSFKDTLATAKNFDEIRKLWTSTRIEYSYDCTDPYSPEYKQEVLSLYRRLTAESYTPMNELTSTKQTADQFDVGYPWVTQNLEVISQEMAKVVQAMRALHSCQLAGGKLIEFGAGWGNLAIPLAKSGQKMTVVDIDDGFLRRITKIAAKDGLEIKCMKGDFLKVAKSITEKYDAVIFQSSFHHCLDFSSILDVIRDRLLSDTGSIFFFSEPIHKDFSFPWGLRYDGESLWAIMCNKWLELGFDQDFFLDLMLRKGFLVSKVEAIPGLVGEGWIASRGSSGIPFENLILPSFHSDSFHSSDTSEGHGRFCREESFLPGLEKSAYSSYECVFQNFSLRDINIFFSSFEKDINAKIPAGKERTVRLSGQCKNVSIRSETYVPNDMYGNGDTRSIGVALKSISLL
jgi:2-polyprenyl-3-methyl-5-hydroxy-6-metoxy-1,4-benzoquinol methylase